MNKAIVLFAHGSRDGEWARPFEALAATLSRQVEARVSLAFLESMQPSLGEAIAALAGEGVTSIRVVPVFFGQGGHTKHDLPKLAAAARDQHPGLHISLEAPIGQQASVIDAIAAAIARSG